LRICWFDNFRLGVVRGEGFVDVSDVLDRIALGAYPFNKGDALVSAYPEFAYQIATMAEKRRHLSIASIKHFSPVMRPNKIIGTPVNYLSHTEEVDANREDFTARYSGS
jgi:2,4-diketo-3-deoxy-L-fuconate hydrolase